MLEIFLKRLKKCTLCKCMFFFRQFFSTQYNNIVAGDSDEEKDSNSNYNFSTFRLYIR